MKRLFGICLSLILLLSFTVSAYADEVRMLDPITGEIVDEYGNSSSTVRISTKCKFDRTDKMYIYTIGVVSSTDVMCSVYDGMITTEPVVIKEGSSSSIEVYRSGELVDPSEYENLSQPGSYVVNSKFDSSELFSFTIVPYITNAISMYKVPAIFYISSARYNDEDIKVTGNTVKFENDGIYHIEYVGTRSNVGYTLDVKIDLTYPELEIIGVDEDGIARGPVSFGELEPDSVLTVTVDGQPVDNSPVNGQFVTAGQYTVKYADKAGNVSSYYFTMNVFLNVSATAFVIILGLVIVLAVAYLIYSRKNRRVR